MKTIWMGAAALLAAVGAAAQEAKPPPPAETAPEPDTVGLLEATVTASRRREVALESPRSQSVVHRDEMDRHQSRTTPEALMEEPGVWVQRTNYGGGNAFVRGQFGNRILILVDGIRLNNSTFRAGPNQYLNTIDPLLVDRIEIVRGTGSALHGSDAIGAAINVITQAAELAPYKPYRADVRLAGSSADMGGQAGVRLGFGGQAVGLLATGSARHFGELRGGGATGVQHFTGYDEWSASASAITALSDKQRLVAAFQTTRQFDVPRTDRSTPGDIRMFTLQARQLGYLRLLSDEAGPFSSMKATASFHLQRELSDRFRVGRDAQERDDSRVGTLGLQVDGETSVAGGPLVAGVEGYFDFLGSKAARGVLSTRAMADRPELARYGSGVGYQSAAAFAGHTLKLARQWSLHTEARLGVVRVDLPADDRLQRLFPTAGLPVLEAHVDVVPVYAGGVHLHFAPTPAVALNGSVSLGFRAPNLDDQARVGVEGGNFLLPTRGLKPERALSGEINAKTAFGKVEATFAYAYTHIFDALGREGATIEGQAVLDGQRVARLANADAARYHAVEASVRVPVWRRLNAFGNASYAYGQIRRTVPAADPSAVPSVIDEPAEKVPPLFGKAGVSWNAPGGLWFAEGLLRWAIKQDRLGAADLGDPRICPQDPRGACVGTPGWTTFTLRGGVSLFGHAKLTLALENLTDAQYRMHGSGIDGPGRSVVALLEGSL